MNSIYLLALFKSIHIFELFGGQQGTMFVEGLSDATSDRPGLEDTWSSQFFDYTLGSKMHALLRNQ